MSIIVNNYLSIKKKQILKEWFQNYMDKILRL